VSYIILYGLVATWNYSNVMQNQVKVVCFIRGRIQSRVVCLELL